MAASVAILAAPRLVAAYVLKQPKEVEDSNNDWKLVLPSLFAPLVRVVVQVGAPIIQIRNKGTD